MDNNEWLSLKEVAAELRVNPVTIMRLIETGELQAVRVGRLWRIKRSELERYLGREPKTI